MVKRASDSQKIRSSASGGGKISSTNTERSKQKLGLNIKHSSEDTKRTDSRASLKTTLKKHKTKKTQKKKIDALKPKKPPTAFFYFLEDFRKVYQEQNPEVKSMRDIGKACGEKWKTMTYEEKVQYYDIATEKRAEFDKAMAEYVKRKELGEDQEFEDSEFDGDD